jgi:heme/copper-type cytochrome/quinol oxidase subunit 4
MRNKLKSVIRYPVKNLESNSPFLDFRNYIKVLLITVIIASVTFIAYRVFGSPAFTIHQVGLGILFGPGLWGIIFACVCFFDLNEKWSKRVLIFIFVLPAFIWLILFPGSFKWFRSGSYQKLAKVTEMEEIGDRISHFDVHNVPVIDNEQANILGARALGSAPEIVGKYRTPSYYTTNIYQNRLVRVAPLEYSGLINKWKLTNEGIPGYILIDMVTGEADYVKLENPIRYSTSEFFLNSHNLTVKMRSEFPSTMFYDPSFELDEEGNPYWIISKVKKTIGVRGGNDVGDVFLLNAVTGEVERYVQEEVPDWVDRIYPTKLIMSQLSDYGEYINGFWNSVFGKQGVLRTSYSYLSKDSQGMAYLMLPDAKGNNRLFVYTGQTSAVEGDESNIGFTLTNIRTNETEQYRIALAEEESVMESAKGKVQEKGYEASFPFLMERNGKMTYLLTLKDNSGLTRMFAAIDGKDYQKVVIGETVKEVLDNFDKTYGKDMDPDYKIEDPINRPKPLDENNFINTTIEIPVNCKTIELDGTTHFVFENYGKTHIMRVDLCFEALWTKEPIKLNVICSVQRTHNEVFKVETSNEDN